MKMNTNLSAEDYLLLFYRLVKAITPVNMREHLRTLKQVINMLFYCQSLFWDDMYYKILIEV